MSNPRVEISARAALENGRRLIDDADFLQFSDPPSTAYFLSQVAQEEIAKAFLLALVKRGIVPWDRHILRATRDHRCKQLLCVVMEYVSPDIDEFLARGKARVLRHEVAGLPARVADAINILRHEKIGRWVSKSWVWAEDPEYDPDALGICRGKKDKQKQDALYVRLAADGGLAGTPARITQEMVENAMEQAGRFATLVQNLLEGQPCRGLDWQMVEEVLRILFSESP